MKKIITTLVILMMTLQIFAQNQNPAISSDSLYASDKIYVVVVCAAVILLGLILFLFSIDRRLKKLEKYSSAKN
jgi:EamA domain-containing membrane protein RarD